MTYAASGAGVVAGGGADGVVRCVAPGSWVVTATAVDGPRRGTAILTVTVAAPPAPLVVTLNPRAIACAVGERVTVDAVVGGGVGAPSVAFEASNTNVTVTGAGNAASVVCVRPGTAVITATATSGRQTAHASVTATVTPPPPPLVATAAPSSLSCFPGETRTVTLTISGGRDSPTVTASAANANVVVAATSSGMLTVTCAAPGASSAGYTVTSGSQTVAGSVPVIVASAVTAVDVAPSALALAPGASASLQATVTLAVGAPALTPTSVRWSSSDPTAVAVDAGGRVTALGAAGRSAVVTATPTANAALRAGAVITIVARTLVAGLAVTPTSATIAAGGSLQLSAVVTLTPDAPAGTSTAVTYTTSNAAVATVSAGGLVSAGATPGTAIVTVTSVAAPGVTQQVGVTVAPALPARVRIERVETFDASGQLVPIDPASVRGQLRMTLGIDPGGSVADSVVVTLGSARVVCQRYFSGYSRAVRAALSGGAADFTATQCAINTAQFDPVSGAVRFRNGTHSLGAALYTHRPGGAQESASTTAGSVTLSNRSGYAVSAFSRQIPARVATARGATWLGGEIGVVAVPVFYDAPDLRPVTIRLVDNATGRAVSSRSAMLGADGRYTVSFPAQAAPFTATPPAGTLTGYTSPGSGGGTRMTVVGAPGMTHYTPDGTTVADGPVVYVDNTPPEARAQWVSRGPLQLAGSTGFLAPTFFFDANVQQAPATTPFGDHDGSGASRYYAAGFATTFDLAAFSPLSAFVQAAGQLPRTTTPDYAIAVVVTDAVRNSVTVPLGVNGGGTFRFGVDGTPPTSAIRGVTDGAEYRTHPPIELVVTDDAGVAPVPAVARIVLANASGTHCSVHSAAGVIVGFTPVTGTCFMQPTSGVAIAGPPVPGTYTVTFDGVDLAGNLAPRRVLTYAIVP